MRDDIEQFKRDLKSYKYYKKCIKIKQDDILVIESKLLGIKSPRMDAMPSGSHFDNRIDLITKRDKIQNELDVYLKLINDIDYKLNKLDKEEQDIIKLVYIENVSIRKMARTYYLSDASMFRWINKILKKATS